MQLSKEEVLKVKDMIDYVENELTTTLNKFSFMKVKKEYKRAENARDALQELQNELQVDEKEFYDIELINHMEALLELDKKVKSRLF